MHYQWNRCDGNFIRFIEPEVSSTGCTIGHLPPTVERSGVGENRICRRDDGFCSIGGEEHGDRDNRVIITDDVENTFSSAYDTTIYTDYCIWGNVLVYLETIAVVCDRPVSTSIHL